MVVTWCYHLAITGGRRGLTLARSTAGETEGAAIADHHCAASAGAPYLRACGAAKTRNQHQGGRRNKAVGRRNQHRRGGGRTLFCRGVHGWGSSKFGSPSSARVHCGHLS